MIFKFRLILVLLLGFVVFSCEKDDDTQNTPNNTEPNDALFASENFGTTITADFFGVIKDVNGDPLSDAMVTIGTTSETTDDLGVFSFRDVNVFENFAYIQVKKSGYLNGSRVIIPNENQTNRVNIVMLAIEVTETITTGETTEVALPNGAQVTFPGDFIDANGNPYSGQVEVALNYLPPNTAETFVQMPGSLFAQTSQNAAVGLETYGMLAVNLFSPSGDELNIDPNTEATIELPVDTSQLGIAPEAIPLWSFDEEVGYWKQEGEAIKVNNKFVGEVSHFSWWNYDLPIEYVEFCFSVEPNNIVDNTLYIIEILRENENQLIYYNEVVSNQSIACGLIPQNENIIVNIYESNVCDGELIHSEVLGPFSIATTEIIDFDIVPNTTTITGAVNNCDGLPVTDGYLVIDNNVVLNITNGLFSYNLSSCVNSVDISVYDMDTSQWTGNIQVGLNGEFQNLGSLSTCQNTGAVFIGDVFLSTQEEVNNFGIFNYSAINGNFRIGIDGNGFSDIVDLTPLSNLQSVNQNPLSSLASGFVQIVNNADLVSLEGLNLQTMRGLIIENNSSLSTIEDLNITDFQYEDSTDNIIVVIDNPALNSLVGLESISGVYYLLVRNNPNLLNLEGLNGIVQVNTLDIDNNSNLQALDGLESLSAANVGTFTPGIVRFRNHSNLTNFCQLQNFFSSGTYLVDNVQISGNAFNPTVQQIIDGNCSQ